MYDENNNKVTESRASN